MAWSSPIILTVFTATLRVLIAVLAIVLCVWLQLMPESSRSNASDEWLRDQIIRLHASDIPEQRIVVVDIDEASLTAAGPWPWPRTRLAALLESLLVDYAVKGIALDIVLPEHADAAGDARLAALAQHGPVVLAQVFDYVPRPVPLRVGTLAGGTLDVGREPVATAIGFVANHSGLALAKVTGNIGFVPDQNGMLRRLPMWTVFQGIQYPALSLALFDCCAAASNLSHPRKAVESFTESFSRIPFSRNWSSYTVISAADILNLRTPATMLSGRLALVGSSALGLSDRVATPLSASTSGVLVHAAQLTTLLDRQSGNTPDRWLGQWIAVVFSLVVSALAIYSFPRLSAVFNMTLLGGMALVWLALAYLICPHDPHFSVSGPLLSIVFLLVVGVPFDWQVTQHESHQLLGTLRQYVAKSVVDELMRSDVKDPLAPVQREVTTLIVDMEGYTGHVESLPISDAAMLTRDFLDCLTRPVLNLGGTLDKYTGDGLVAFWGAPLPVAEHADLALDAAQQIIEEVRQLSMQRELDGKLPLRVRIGIESGLAMAGDFGSSSRSIYTAVGDSVNTASRLQVLARDFPYDIIVGQGTATLASQHRFKSLGEVVLRGKGKPTAIYALELSGL